jgi:hypothetical protein
VKIELDERPDVLPPTPHRQVSQEIPPVLPEVVPVLDEKNVGTDEAERTLGYLFLASAVPALLMAFRAGPSSLTGLVFPLVAAYGLLTGEETILRFLKLICLANVALAVMATFLLGRHFAMGLVLVVRSLAFLLLASEIPLSKAAYYACVGVICLGILTSFVGVFLA